MNYTKNTILIEKKTGTKYKFVYLLYDRVTLQNLETSERITYTWEDIENEFEIIEDISAIDTI